MVSKVANGSSLPIFTKWENHLEQEPVKPQEHKKVIEKFEYKGPQKVRKEVEVKTFTV